MASTRIAPSLFVTQSRGGNLSLWDTSRLMSSTALVQAVATVRTETHSYAKAFLMDLTSVPNMSGLNEGHSMDQLDSESDRPGDVSQSVSSSPLLCVAPTADNRSMAVFDLTRVKSSRGAVLQLGQIKRPRKATSSNVPLTPSLEHPGWVVGGGPLPFMNAFCCLLAYQCFGAQGIFDLRYPSHPIAEPLWMSETSPIKETVSLGLARTTSWIGTDNGYVISSDIDATGKIQPTHQLDLFPEARDVSSSSGRSKDDNKDLLELRQQEISLMQHRGKLGIGAIQFRCDSRLAAVGCWDNTVRLFDVRSNQPLEILNYHTDSIQAVDFDSTTGAFAVGSKDTRISCWHLHCSSLAC